MVKAEVLDINFENSSNGFFKILFYFLIINETRINNKMI